MTALPEMLAELKAQQATKVDFVVDSRKLRMSNGEEMDILDVEPGEMPLDGLGITGHAHGQIAARLNVPKKFYDRLRGTHPDVLDHTVNTLWQREPETRMVRTLGGDVRAYLSDRYRRLDNLDLAEHVLPVLGELAERNGGIEIVGSELTPNRMYVSWQFPRKTAEVKLGDVVTIGGIVTNSEIGAGALNVETRVYRLVCLNGLITGSTLRKYHTGARIEESEGALAVFSDATLSLDDQAFFAKAQDLVRASASEAEFEQLVGQLKELAGLRIEGDPVKATERLQARFDLSDEERGSVVNHLINGGDLSAWGLINATTATARDLEDADRSYELEKLAGGLAFGEAKELEAVLVG